MESIASFLCVGFDCRLESDSSLPDRGKLGVMHTSHVMVGDPRDLFFFPRRRRRRRSLRGRGRRRRRNLKRLSIKPGTFTGDFDGCLFAFRGRMLAIAWPSPRRRLMKFSWVGIENPPLDMACTCDVISKVPQTDSYVCCNLSPLRIVYTGMCRMFPLGLG